MSCHKAIVVITGRVHCFHDDVYTAPISFLRHLSTLCRGSLISTTEIQSQSLFPMIKELFNQPLINMDAIEEIEPHVYSVINVFWQTLYIKQQHQLPSNQIINILVLLKLHLRNNSETTQEISTIRSILTALNFLNTCENVKNNKMKNNA